MDFLWFVLEVSNCFLWLLLFSPEFEVKRCSSFTDVAPSFHFQNHLYFQRGSICHLTLCSPLPHFTFSSSSFCHLLEKMISLVEVVWSLWSFQKWFMWLFSYQQLVSSARCHEAFSAWVVWKWKLKPNYFFTWIFNRKNSKVGYVDSIQNYFRWRFIAHWKSKSLI